MWWGGGALILWLINWSHSRKWKWICFIVIYTERHMLCLLVLTNLIFNLVHRRITWKSLCHSKACIWSICGLSSPSEHQRRRTIVLLVQLAAAQLLLVRYSHSVTFRKYDSGWLAKIFYKHRNLYQLLEKKSNALSYLQKKCRMTAPILSQPIFLLHTSTPTSNFCSKDWNVTTCPVLNLLSVVCLFLLFFQFKMVSSSWENQFSAMYCNCRATLLKKKDRLEH